MGSKFRSEENKRGREKKKVGQKCKRMKKMEEDGSGEKQLLKD